MKPGGDKNWFVYVLRCGDGSLYTGVTNDLEARVRKHGCGKGAAYTRSRLPVTLLYRESNLTRSEALVREAEIKRWPRARKEKLVSLPSVVPS